MERTRERVAWGEGTVGRNVAKVGLNLGSKALPSPPSLDPVGGLPWSRDGRPITKYIYVIYLINLSNPQIKTFWPIVDGVKEGETLGIRTMLDVGWTRMIPNL
jgi:hypothetical protein